MERPKSMPRPHRGPKLGGSTSSALSGEDIPLGPACGVTLEANRTRALAEWYSRGKPARHQIDLAITIDERIVARFEHIEAAYSDSDRTVYHASRTMKLAFQPLLIAYGREPAADCTVEKFEWLRDTCARQTVKR